MKKFARIIVVLGVVVLITMGLLSGCGGGRPSGTFWGMTRGLETTLTFSGNRFAIARDSGTFMCGSCGRMNFTTTGEGTFSVRGDIIEFITTRETIDCCNRTDEFRDVWRVPFFNGGDYLDIDGDRFFRDRR